MKVQPLADVLPGADASRYVGSHPMAGREKSGPVAARGELFQARPWIICEHDSVRPECVRLCVLWRWSWGAIVTSLSVEEHDQTVALISCAAGDEFAVGFASAGHLRCMRCPWRVRLPTVRIAASDPTLWCRFLRRTLTRLCRPSTGCVMT